MAAFLLAAFSFFCGALVVYFAIETRKRRLAELERKLNEQSEEQNARHDSLVTAGRKLNEDRDNLSREILAFHERRKEFDARVIAYDQLVEENRMIKTDLRGIAMVSAKQDHERVELDLRQRSYEEKANELGSEFLKETQKWIASSLTPNNYSASKERLTRAIAKIRNIGVAITPHDEALNLKELQQEYERVVRIAADREEQARIRAQIREEQQREREIERLKEQAERAARDKQALEEALARAKVEAANEITGRYNEEVMRLQQQLTAVNEALEQSQRAVSQAQLTRAGNVYVISNVGSFGSGVFKIGMTRRLEPLDRVVELGDASVPFPFDVHMMVACQDAPRLENALHKAFHKTRLNKTNPRKEFFRTTIQEIVKIVEDNHGTVEYKIDPVAQQYYDSMSMKDEDEEYIEGVFDEVEADKPNELEGEI